MIIKKVWLLLAIAGISTQVNSQIKYSGKPPQMSELTFGGPDKDFVKASFRFYFGKGNQVLFEMIDLKQLNYLPDLDSLFTTVKTALQPLQDSFSADGMVRRIDFVASKQVAPKMRIIQHARPNNYSYVDSELVRLKVDSDTLRVHVYTQSGKVEKFKVSERTVWEYGTLSFSIFFVVNNLADIYELPDAILSQCLARLKPEADKYLLKPEAVKPEDRFSGHFNMAGTSLGPEKVNVVKKYKRKYISSSILAGLQYTRGTFIPSMGLGAQFVWKGGMLTGNTNYLRLLWEPYFSFSRSADNKLQTDRNDFITMHLTQIDTADAKPGKISVTGNMSLGYLVGRQGETFNKHTFKWSFVALTHGALLLSPELIFNNFFKNVSPSVKLTLWFE